MGFDRGKIKMKRFKSKFLTKLFEIINSKVSFPERKKEQEDIEEEYNFHLDDQAKYQEYQQWKKFREERQPDINVKRKFKVLSSPIPNLVLGFNTEYAKPSVIPISKECKFKDLNYEWVYELAAKQNVYVMITDEFDNVYLRINPAGKNIDMSWESEKARDLGYENF